MNFTSNLKQMEFHYYFYNEFGLTKAKSKQRSMLAERCTMFKLLIPKYAYHFLQTAFGPHRHVKSNFMFPNSFQNPKSYNLFIFTELLGQRETDISKVKFSNFSDLVIFRYASSLAHFQQL